MNRLRDIDTCDIEASDSIDAQAASWFARNRNDAGRADRKAFAAWQCEPAHARAYAEFEQLWADLAHELKALGAHNLNPGRPGGLTGRARIVALVQAYEQFRQAQGLPATYQVVYAVLEKPL